MPYSPSGPSAGVGGSTGGGGGGLGVDVPLLEAAVRGLAYLAGSGHEGRLAVTGSRAVRRLVAVVRTDNAALEAVRERRREEGERCSGVRSSVPASLQMPYAAWDPFVIELLLALPLYLPS